MLIAQQGSIGPIGAWLLMIGVGLLLAGSGALVAGIASRTADGRIGVNGVAGIRTRATRASPQAWDVAHRVAYQPTVQGGRAMQASAVLAPAIGLALGGGDWDRVVTIWAIVIGVGGGVVAVAFVVYGALVGDRAAKAISSE